jgi:ParB family chromosome partitioning protein
MTAPVLMQIDKVAVAEVAAHDRLRPISEAGVESLIASITELGVMKDAIHVRKRRDGQLTLIAGGHRLEAARRLGWEDLPAKVWTGVTDDWARLMEIDDNLAGAEMCALDNAIFLAQRKIIYERLHPDVKKGGDRKSPNFKNLTDTMSVRSFAAATAEKFGLSDRHVFRMIAAGTALDAAEITRLRAAPQSVSLADLQAISKVTSAAERAHVVDALAAGSAKSAAAARAQFAAHKNGVESRLKDPVEAAFNALSSLWTRAPMAAKRRFAGEYAREIAALLPVVPEASE